MSKGIWLLVIILFAIGVVFLTFPHMVLHPGHVVPGITGDAGKNIFAYLYHILYDRGYWFSGMNYPYGEHIIYTDGQPLLSVTLSYFKDTTISQALGVMWCVILLSYILAIIYVNKVLLHFGVRPFFALLFSGLIVVMSPQLCRTLGHFGLSYACVIPMLFYWTIKYNQSPHRRYGAYIFALGLLTTFLHPYFSAVVLLWVSFYTAGHFIFEKTDIRSKLKHGLPLMASMGLLIAATGIIIKSTDPVRDRPETPYGLTAYCANGAHIFTSHYSPIWSYLETHTAVIKNTSGGEGFTYLGIVAIIAFLCSLGSWLCDKGKKRGGVSVSGSRSFQPVWFFMAFASLLFSMGVPFVWHMEWIVTYLSFLRQFRTLGRFSWIFYYIVTIYGAVAVYAYCARQMLAGRKVIAYCLLVLSLGLWGFEASGYIATERNAINNSQGNYDILCGNKGISWSQFLAANHYNAGDFQSILLMRFFNVGSDKLWLGRGETDIEIAAGMVSGIQLHLPMINAAMARSSWGTAMKQVKIAAGPFVNKPMLKDLPDRKPFLLLNNNNDELDADQKYLLTASDYIGTNNGWRVYACYPDRIEANDKKYGDSVRRITPYLEKGDTCIGGMGTWYVNHFDSGNAADVFFGNGAISQIMQHEAVVAGIPVKPESANRQYEFSCWFLLGSENYRSPYFKLGFLDAAGNTLSEMDVLTKESTDNKGMWFRAFLFFTMPSNCSSITCRLFNDPDNAYKVMDEMVLRPADALVISKSADSKIMVNNHLFLQ